MRLFRTLFVHYRHAPSKNARIAMDQNKVPFKAILPMKLKNRVSGKVDSQTSASCLQEMSVVFAALKDNEFNEKHCAREIQSLQKANIEGMNRAREDKLKNSGQISTVGKQLNSKQLNRYLKKYPDF